MSSGSHGDRGSVEPEMRRAMMVMMLMTVVTWNLQRVSSREQNRGRLCRVAEWVE